MGSSGGGGLLGGVSQTLFGDGGAGAAQAAAMEQQRQARANYREIKGIGEQMTTQGLANFDRALAAQERNLSRQEEMVKQIDPTILAASQEALKLLRGESSKSLKPIQDQRKQQRESLLATLRAQLGPGAETSTAGIQALNRFDAETNNMLAGQQSQALQGINQTFATFSPYGDQINQSIGQMGNLSGNRANIQGNYANLLLGAQAPLTQTAGAQYTADVMRGQQNYSFGQQVFGTALTAGAAYATGGASLVGSWNPQQRPPNTSDPR